MKRIALIVTCLAALGLAACSGGTGSSPLPSVQTLSVSRHATDGGIGPGFAGMAMRVVGGATQTPAPSSTPAPVYYGGW